MTGALSGRQQNILDFLVSYIAENEYPPTVREIADAVGLSSAHTAHYQLGQLMAKGAIRRVPGKPRALRIVHLTPVPEETNDAN